MVAFEVAVCFTVVLSSVGQLDWGCLEENMLTVVLTVLCCAMLCAGRSCRGHFCPLVAGD